HGDFPLALTTGRLAGQWHTMPRTAKSADLLAADPEPFDELHPADAEPAGVRDGARVRLVSRRGEAHLKARLTDRVPQGTAFAPFHWGALHLPPGAGALNAVTSPALDPVSRQAELKACAVRVEPARTPARRPARAPQRLLVVGGGMAGLAAVGAVMEQDPSHFDVTIVGPETQLPSQRVPLAAPLAGHHPPPRL